MSSEVEKKRREVFEIKGLELGLTRGHFKKGDDGEYVNFPTQCYWDFFNAALDAVEIELPSLGICAMTNELLGYQRGLRDARERIEATSLGLKVK